MNTQHIQTGYRKELSAMKTITQLPTILCTLALASFIAGCGSSADGFVAGTGSSTTFSLGTGTGTGFTADALSIAISTIAPQASTTISVNVVDENNQLYTSAATLTFSSTCAIQNLASFNTTQVTTTTGSVAVIYTDIACTSSDTITVSATDPAGNSHTATGTISISAGGGGTTGAIRIGNGTGAGFVNGALNIGTATLSAGGSTAVIANIVDANGNLVTTSTTVTFTSNCVAAATATFSSSSVTTTTGTASSTYTAAGCTGADTITAATTSQGSPIAATGTVTVAAPSLGTIQYTSVTETVIALAGTGNTLGIPENSVITFTVLDSAGAPLAGRTVNFTLNTSVGGVSLAAASDVSDASGIVQATVQSGSVATSVRVTATVAGSALSTQSNAIVIRTGLPDQDSMSLSAVTLNPRTWNQDGVTVAITARVSDRYNNPIQDGTTILFTTELGSIAGSCASANNTGACSVNWTSSNPRGTQANAGRTTIIATVLGEESFTDTNGNGVFDTGDTQTTDMAEAFLDIDEDGLYDAGETLYDLNVNGIADPADGMFNGVNCTFNCGIQNTITVRDDLVLVMAEDTAATPTVSLNGAAFGAMPASITLSPAIDTYTFRIVGAVNGQVLPVGTTINFTSTNGRVLGGASHTVVNTSVNVATTTTAIEEYSIILSTESPTPTPSSGALTLNITFPNSGGTQTFVIPVTD